MIYIYLYNGALNCILYIDQIMNWYEVEIVRYGESDQGVAAYHEATTQIQPKYYFMLSTFIVTTVVNKTVVKANNNKKPQCFFCRYEIKTKPNR